MSLPGILYSLLMCNPCLYSRWYKLVMPNMSREMVVERKYIVETTRLGESEMMPSILLSPAWTGGRAHAYYFPSGDRSP